MRGPKQESPPTPPTSQQEQKHQSIEMTPLEVRTFFERMDPFSDTVSVSVTKQELETVIEKLLLDIRVDADHIKKFFKDPPSETELQEAFGDLRNNTKLFDKLMDIYLRFDVL